MMVVFVLAHIATVLFVVRFNCNFGISGISGTDLGEAVPMGLRGECLNGFWDMLCVLEEEYGEGCALWVWVRHRRSSATQRGA